MPDAYRVLIVDDDRVSRELLSEILRKAGFRPSVADSAEQALEMLDVTPFPLVLSDIRMVELSGVDLLKSIKASSPSTVVVLMTGFGSVDGALEALREGAFDYLSKPFQMDELRQVIARAAKHYERTTDEGTVAGAIAASAPAHGLLGRSSKIVEIYKLIARAALSTSSVLITGEPGTGKALIAQTIHRNSDRRDQPLLTLSHDDLDPTDIEKRLSDAHGGTVVIEELHGLNPSRQVRLVRAIENAEGQELNLRWMALSRKTCEMLSEGDDLRKDLLYQLSVLVLGIPPLRERREDLPEMVSAYIAKCNEHNSKAISHVSAEAMALLSAHSWPRNVRELERVIERAVTLSSTAVLDVEDFRGQIVPEVPTQRESVEGAESLEEVEKRHITDVLRKLSFNKSKAAEALGIDRATLYRKAKLHGISMQVEKRTATDTDK